MKIPLVKSFSPYGPKALLHNRPPALPALVWGAFTTVLLPVFRRPFLSQGVKIWASWMLLAGILAMTDSYVGPVILVYLAVLAGSYFWEKNYMTRELVTAVDTQLQPLLEPWGYQVNHCFENTGECYMEEYSLEVEGFDPGAVKLSPQELLARAPLPSSTSSGTSNGNGTPNDFTMVAEPVVTYLHGTPFQHVVVWQCNWKRPLFVSDPCPLPNVPLCVWGALQNDLWCERLEELQQSYVACVEMWLIVMVFATWMTTGSWAFWILFLSPGLLVILAVGNSYLTTTSRNLAHAQWQQAIRQWQDTVAQYGWQIEYHHAHLEASFLSSPDFWLRFVPLSV